MNIKEKAQDLLEERQQLLTEMEEFRKAFDLRNQRIIEINGSLKTLEELLKESTSDDSKE